jgi:phage terminase large subunit-like protein
LELKQLTSNSIRSLLATYLERKRARFPAVPVCDWIEANCFDPATVNLATWDYQQGRLLRLEDYQRRILSHVLTPRAAGRFPYRTIVWSQIKKSGKTQTAGAVGAWWSDQVDAPNLILCAANDHEQSAGRIFGAMAPTVYRLCGEFPTAKSAMPEVRLRNGSLIKAIPNSYAGESGANYGLTLWSELWAYTSERSRRLYEELIPVPTRKNSLRWIESYAGFEDESDLLLEIFLKVFKDTSETALTARARPVAGLEDIVTTDGHGNERPACLEIPDEGLFMFWDHERRMEWQQGEAGEEYYTQQKNDLRDSAYVRLHENRWQKSAAAFIPEEWWTRSITSENESTGPMVFALDASQRHDTTALVGMRKEGERFRTGYVRAWNPRGVDIDLEETAAAEIIQLASRGLIDGPVWYDPFQLHQVAMNLRKRGIACEEFPQGDERLRADTHLWQLYKDGLIDNPNEPTLAAHIRAAKAKESEGERLRLVKGSLSGSNKIDLAVAQSMAAWKASLNTHGYWSQESTDLLFRAINDRGLGWDDLDDAFNDPPYGKQHY